MSEHLFTEEEITHIVRNAAWARRLAFDILGDHHDAEDLSQESIVALLRSHGLANPRRWLARVVRRKSARRWRREAARVAREREVARPEATSGEVDTTERLETERRLLGHVSSLAEPYRTTVVLRYLDQLPIAEIAFRMHCPAPTVKTRLARGLLQLRTRYERDPEGSGALYGLASCAGVERLGWLRVLRTGAVVIVCSAVAVGLVWTLDSWRLDERTRASAFGAVSAVRHEDESMTSSTAVALSTGGYRFDEPDATNAARSAPGSRALRPVRICSEGFEQADIGARGTLFTPWGDVISHSYAERALVSLGLDCNVTGRSRTIDFGAALAWSDGGVVLTLPRGEVVLIEPNSLTEVGRTSVPDDGTWRVGPCAVDALQRMHVSSGAQRAIHVLGSQLEAIGTWSTTLPGDVLSITSVEHELFVVEQVGPSAVVERSVCTTWGEMPRAAGRTRDIPGVAIGIAATQTHLLLALEQDSRLLVMRRPHISDRGLAWPLETVLFLRNEEGGPLRFNAIATSHDGRWLAVACAPPRAGVAVFSLFE